MAGNVNTPGASVASRIFAVLDCFDLAHTELSLTQVSERSDLPLSTTRRLIAELVEWGALERLVDNRYRVGLRLWQIGVLAPQQRGLREAAAPLLHDLRTATGETAQLVVLDGTEALCVDKASAATAVTNLTQVGGRLPLHATAVGKCLLAHSPRQLVVDLVDSGLSRRTSYTITQPGRLINELREVRRTGIALSQEEMSIGAVSVAAPILAPGGVLRGAIGIVAHSTSRIDHLGPAVRTAALAISRQIQ